MDNETIIGLFWDRDETALAQVREHYGAYMLYIARNLLRDDRDVEECMNDVLLTAWHSIPPNRPKNLKTYLGILIREAAIGVLRRKNAKKRRAQSIGSLEELTGLASKCTVESEIGAQELSRMISDYVRSLGEAERNVFVRRYWHCDTIEAICDMYGFGKSKVKMMLKRTRDGLAEYLKKEGNYEL